MSSERVWEIDFLRALAILLMVTFHIVYDLDWLTNLNVSYEDPFWYWVGKSSALMFMFVSGISSGFSKDTVRRGLKVFCYALIVTVVTYFSLRAEYVRFGILHFLAVSMLLFPVLKKLPVVYLLIISIISIVLGLYFHQSVTNTWLLIPFGLTYPEFSTIDYYPLFPYLGVTTLGIIAYKVFYSKGKRIIKKNWPAPSLYDLGKGPSSTYATSNFSFLNGIKKRQGSNTLTFVSKHSLPIYLLHQPIILAVLYLFKLSGLK